jgi:hypothetical protein
MYDAVDRPVLPSPEQASERPPRKSPWGRALAAGCQAAAWWLIQHPGPISVLTALAVGLAAGLAALLSESTAAAGIGLAGLAVTLLALVDAARCGASVLDADAS